MRKSNLYVLLMLLSFGPISSSVFAQSDAVMYFCEKYDSKDGEIGISDRFTTGYITVMVKSDYELRLRDVHIQFDQYNERTGKFEYYKKFDYTIEPDMKYVFFSKNDDSDLEFEEPGIYRVFLLDNRDKTVASALIEIIRR
jgi:hypothetical protein